MLDIIPGPEQMTALVGTSLYGVWKQLCALIEERYEMDPVWEKAGKRGPMSINTAGAEKTLCALYARENCIGFMVILGKEERLKLKKAGSLHRGSSKEVYEEAQTYHDGKWMMFEPTDTALS